MTAWRQRRREPRTTVRVVTARVVVVAMVAIVSLVAVVASANRTLATTDSGHAVGVVTRTLVDASRPTPRSGDQPRHPGRTLETTIWYPALGTAGATTEGAAPDVAGGPYPLIVFAHGLGGTPAAYESVVTRLAAAGYVVAAPRFPLSSGGGTGPPDAADVVNQPGDAHLEPRVRRVGVPHRRNGLGPQGRPVDVRCAGVRCHGGAQVSSPLR